ncbi:MAG: hypothetical protein WD904_09720 [Dehalococcoidia bacterium]
MRSLILTAWTVLVAIVLTLVGLRFLALLADANRDSELVSELYRYSEFWVKPFFEMLSLKNEAVDGGGTFEPASLLAFVVYLIIGGVVGSFLSGSFYARMHHA